MPLRLILQHTLRYEWQYHNLFLLIGGAIAAVLLVQQPGFTAVLDGFGAFGYFGGFLAGLFFSYGSTTVPSIAVLYLLASHLHPLPLSLLAAAGAMLSDYLIFRFVKNNLIAEIAHIMDVLRIHPHFHKPRRWKWLVPLVAGFIIASPLPDELASVLCGMAHYEAKRFVLLSYTLNFAGIFVVALAGNGWRL